MEIKKDEPNVSLDIENNNYRYLWLTIAGCIVGIVFALIATYQTLQLQENALNGAFMCVNSGLLACTAAHTSSFSMIAGVPVAWFGFLFYWWLGVTVGWTIFKGYRIDGAIAAVFNISLIALGFTFYFALVMILKLKAICLLCVALYIVNSLLIFSLKKYLCVPFLKVPQFIYESFRNLFQRKSNSSSFMRPGIFYFSLSLTLFVGVGFLYFVEQNVLRRERLDVKKEVDIHFLQPKININLNSPVPIWGNQHSSVTIIEFSDFQCPFCKESALHLRGLLAEFSKKVQLKFVNFPLDKTINPFVSLESHDKAALAARAAVCAQVFGGFWEYHDDIFANQDEINKQLLLTLAEERGWNPEDFQLCMDSEETLRNLKVQIHDTHAVRIYGTPTIFINGRVVKYWYHPLILRTIIQKELEIVKINSTVQNNG